MALGMAVIGIEMNCGVYKITDVETGQFYIGSAKNLRVRKSGHFSQLKQSKHGNLHLQRIHNKGRNLSFEVYIYTRSEDRLMFEQRCLDILKPELNKSLDAKAPMSGRKHSKKTLELMRYNNGIKRKFRKFSEFEIVEIIKSELSYREIAKKFGMSLTQVGRIKTGECHSDIASEIPRLVKKQVSKLTKQELDEIKNSGEKNCVLANRYGIDASSVSKLKSRHRLNQIKLGNN
jgi:group I intron endonuclease